MRKSCSNCMFCKLSIYYKEDKKYNYVYSCRTSEGDLVIEPNGKCKAFIRHDGMQTRMKLIGFTAEQALEALNLSHLLA